MVKLKPHQNNELFYIKVADAYRRAVANGEQPAVVIAQAFFAERTSQVHGWIRRCRTLGLLEPTRQGRVTLRDPYVDALAHALAISYESVVNALSSISKPDESIRLYSYKRNNPKQQREPEQ